MKFIVSPLLLTVLALSSFSGAFRAPAPPGVGPNPDYSRRIQIWSHEYDPDPAPQNPELEREVRMVVDSVVADVGQGPVIARVRMALEDRYGTMLSETTQPASYIWLWLEGVWLRVCYTRSLFEIDFGSRGEIYVEIAEGPVMR